MAKSVQMPSSSSSFHNRMLRGENCGCGCLAKGDTTNPAAYKTNEDFQSDEVTRAGREKEGVRRGEDSASALVRGAGVAWNLAGRKRFWWTKSGPIRRERGLQRALGRADGAASRLSRPGQVQPFPAPSPLTNIPEDYSGETNMYLSRDDMPLHQDGQFPQICWASSRGRCRSS